MYDVAKATNTSPYTSDDIRVKHAEIFRPGLGLHTKAKAIVYLKPGSKPVFCPKHPVLCAALKSVDEKFDYLKSLGELNYSSWSASIVAVGLCANFSTGVNAC